MLTYSEWVGIGKYYCCCQFVLMLYVCVILIMPFILWNGIYYYVNFNLEIEHKAHWFCLVDF